MSRRAQRTASAAPALNASTRAAHGYTFVIREGEDALPRKPRQHKQIVAFKVEPDLAALLDAMPNKSEFIRNAVARQLSTACPLCRGTGIAPFTGVTDELTRLVQQHPLCVCAG